MKSVFKLARLIVYGASQVQPEAEWEMNRYAFARVLKRNPENVFAKLFRIYDGRCGLACADFDEALSMAHAACLLWYVSPSYNYFVLPAKRAAAEVPKEGYTEEEKLGAVAIMSEYWKELRGDMV